MPRLPLPIGTWGTVTVRPTQRGYTARATYRDYMGTRHQITRSAASKTAARHLLVEAINSRLTADDSELITSATPLSTLLDAWLTDKNGVSSSTINVYRQRIDRTITPAIGGMLIREATPARLDRFIRGLLTTPAVAKMARTILVQALAYAVQAGAAPDNAAEKIRAVTPERKTVTALNPDAVHALRSQLQKWDAAHPGADLDAVAQILIATGMRTGEALALRWEDVNLDVGTVTISGTEKDGERQEHPKTESSRRTLTLPPTVVTMLTARRVNAAWEMVYPSATGTYRWSANFRRSWRAALAGTDCAAVSPKGFRKSVATYLDEQIGVEAAQAQLGHESTAVAKRHYIESRVPVVDFSATLETLFQKCE